MNEERREAIVALLKTRDDELPLPNRGSAPAAPRGFVSGIDDKGQPVRWLTCPDCLANDIPVVGNRAASSGCETCGGRGEIPDLGPDPYAKNEQVLPFGFEATRHDDSHARDRTIEALRQQTRPPRSEAELLEDANRRGYAWEEERRGMYRRYDYAALDHALDELRNYDEPAYHALHSVYVYAWMTELSPAAELAVGRGLAFLAMILPDPLRAPGMPDHPAVDRQRRRRAA